MTTHHLPISSPVILSFPGPDRSIQMEALRQGKAVSRRYRNRRIGEFLKELELTEGRSTGIPKMLRVMAENGSPLPEFETDEDRTHYLVRLPVHANADWQDLATDPASDPVADPVEGATGQTGTTQGPSKDPVKGPSRHQVEAPSKHQVLNPLIEQGFIEMTQPESPNSPTQKYRLTAKGRKLLETL